jgi:hypothetical protein
LLTDHRVLHDIRVEQIKKRRCDSSRLPAIPDASTQKEVTAMATQSFSTRNRRRKHRQPLVRVRQKLCPIRTRHPIQGVTGAAAAGRLTASVTRGANSGEAVSPSCKRWRGSRHTVVRRVADTPAVFSLIYSAIMYSGRPREHISRACSPVSYVTTCLATRQLWRVLGAGDAGRVISYTLPSVHQNVLEPALPVEVKVKVSPP